MMCPPRVNFKSLSAAGWAYTIVNLLAGAASSVFKKLIMGTEVQRCPDCQPHKFRYPLFITVCQFASQVFCLLLWAVQVFVKKFTARTGVDSESDTSSAVRVAEQYNTTETRQITNAVQSSQELESEKEHSTQNLQKSDVSEQQNRSENKQ